MKDARCSTLCWDSRFRVKIHVMYVRGCSETPITNIRVSVLQDAVFWGGGGGGQSCLSSQLHMVGSMVPHTIYENKTL